MAKTFLLLYTVYWKLFAKENVRGFRESTYMHSRNFSCHYFPKYNMSLMKYFSREKTKDDPSGPLNEAVPSSIEEASKEVSAQRGAQPS